MSFADRLNEQIRQKGTPCIVGLDPDLALFPDETLKGLPREISAERIGAVAQLYLELNRQVIDAVHDLVPAVKPQSAFYERLGSRGIETLERTIAYARERGLLVILDGKRGDVSATAEAYAQSYIGPRDAPLASDALTINPYLGDDSLTPFFRACQTYDTGVFVLAVTSNPGSGRLQSLEADGKAVYQHVAAMIRDLDPDPSAEYSPIGIVAGATYPDQAAWLRNALPRSIFLVPGMGAQGGDASGLKAFFNPDGLGAVVSNSRAIMFPHRFGGAKSYREAAVGFIGDVHSALR